MKGGFGNMGDMMKKVQRMQQDMQKAQEELAALEVPGEAGGGMVKVIMTGRHELKRVAIDSALMGDDKEMLEDLIAAAVNDAVQRLEKTSQERMAGMMSGIPLPPGMKLPF